LAARPLGPLASRGPYARAYHACWLVVNPALLVSIETLKYMAYIQVYYQHAGMESSSLRTVLVLKDKILWSSLALALKASGLGLGLVLEAPFAAKY